MKNFSSKKKANFRRSSNQSVYRAIAGVCFALVCVFLFKSFGGSFIASATTPLFYFQKWVSESSGTIPSYIRDRNTLVAELESLRRKNDEFAGADDYRKVLESENERLRKLLRDGEVSPRIVAGVIARPPHLPYDGLLIDKGSSDGIKEGGVVYLSYDNVVGVVQKVFTDSAFVVLFSTPGIETTVYILGPNIYTTAIGEGDGSVRVSVPQGVPLTEGDVVLLPSLRRGILGKIGSVESGEAEPEQYGYITMSPSLQSAHTVAVGTEVQTPVSFEEATQFVEEYTEELFVVPVPEEMQSNDSPQGDTEDTATSSEALN